MNIKPKGSYFLIPIGLLLISGIVTAILFYQAIIIPLHNIKVANINEPVIVELNEGDFVALFIDDTEIDRFEFTDFGEYYSIKYFVRNQSYIITITAENNEGELDSLTVQELTSETAYRVDKYYNFADVDILKDGTYTFAFSSYDDINIGFGYITTDYSNSGTKIVLALVIGILGFIGTIVSFIVIISKRSKSRQVLGNPLEENKQDLNMDTKEELLES